jgi:transcriptional regulator with XRE-family HTH domain
MPQSELPAYLRSQIDSRGWDDGMLARKAGIHKSTLSKLISDPNIVPELTTLEKLSRALGVPLVSLMIAAGRDPGNLETSIESEQLAILVDTRLRNRLRNFHLMSGGRSWRTFVF